jgi:hypothetical protein
LVCGERALPCPGARVSRFTASLILQCPPSSGKSRKLKLSPLNRRVPFRETSRSGAIALAETTSATPLEWRWRNTCGVTGLPRFYLRRLVRRSFWAPRLACVSLVGGGSCSGAYLWLTFSPVSLFITGTLYKAICVPFRLIFAFMNLRHQLLHVLPQFWSPRFIFLQKFITATALPLALRTIMSAPSRHDHPPDPRPANPAGLARPLVDPVLKLKEPAHPFRIHII